MENILINIGTKDEIAQRAIQCVNSAIVADWVFMPLFILTVALDIFVLVVIFSQDIDIKSKVKEGIPLIFILFILVFLVTGLGLELSHTYETRRDISANTDKAVEYYIDMKGFDRYDEYEQNPETAIVEYINIAYTNNDYYAELCKRGIDIYQMN